MRPGGKFVFEWDQIGFFERAMAARSTEQEKDSTVRSRHGNFRVLGVNNTQK